MTQRFVDQLTTSESTWQHVKFADKGDPVQLNVERGSKVGYLNLLLLKARGEVFN